ncbi:MAG: tRNA lysidine(34) synthetase TilS [bacterium]|nr:tRNA lysidine(34) synthetase TilS [bacterium]
MRGARPFAALEQSVLDAFAAIAPGPIAIACSGGPDSVALLAAASAVARPAGRTLVALHVNHSLRATADRDEGVALAAAVHLGVIFKSVRLEPGASDEAALRERRYPALVAMALEAAAVAIATAHTLEDQVETVLLALVRGAGLRGIAGMPERRPLAEGLELLRPLLEHGHAELRAYCHARALPYALDESNQDQRYRRNRLRRLLAQLRDVEPSAEGAIVRLARLAREEDNWLDDQAAQALARLAAQEGRLEGSLRHLPRPLLRRVLRLWLGERDIAFEHVDRLAGAVAEGRSGRFFIRKGEEVRIHDGLLERCKSDDGERA